MDEKKHSFEVPGLFENLENLIEEAKLGKYEARQRVRAINKLANPIFDFSPSDYQRILKKDLPPSVKKGILLYEKMKELTVLVQPIGKIKGAACRVRLIDYKNLTWEEFLELRGTFSFGFISEAIKQKASGKFNGFNLLNEKQRELHKSIAVYFGERKKPTLQSLAIDVIYRETDGKGFSVNSLHNHLKAVKEYQKRRKKAWGVDVFHFSYNAVITFNNNGTVKESVEHTKKAVAEMVTKYNEMLSKLGADLFKIITPQISKNFIPMIKLPNFAEMIRSKIILPNFKNLPKEDD